MQNQITEEFELGLFYFKYFIYVLYFEYFLIHVDFCTLKFCINA